MLLSLIIEPIPYVAKLRPLNYPFRNFILTPVDNQRLRSVCGVLDQNLKHLANTLNIDIRRKGERFMLRGQESDTLVAENLIRKLYEATKHPIELEDIHLHLIEAQQPLPMEQGGTLSLSRMILRMKTQKQAAYLRAIAAHDITFAIGPAGTGKTYLAVAAATAALESGAVSRIVLVRPAVEAGERLGFLPGDLTQKVDPYLRPLYDALYEFLGNDRVVKLIENNTIEIAPLAFMRGRTLNHAFIILDEAQNTTVEQMKMFLTRLGQGAKAVITGDITQIDLPPKERSGLVDTIDVLKNIEEIHFTFFDPADVVRHSLVQKIIIAYESRPK
jgi:phosphate starvation-inducible PhoH-like protein